MLSALISLAVFAVAPLRSFFFSTTGWAESVRVGFGVTSVYVLVLPAALLLAASKSAGRLRLLGLVSSLLMIASITVSQARAAMAACALNVLLAILMPGSWRLGVRRWRILGTSALIALILVMALVMASSLGIRTATVLPHELSQRFGSLMSVSNDPNFQTRQITSDIAVSRWQTSPVTIISGQGLGASMGYYDPGSPRPYDVNLFVDSAWATLAVQGGG